MTKIKLCGLRRLEDITYVNEAGPDFAGVILAANPKFWRAISDEQARRLRDALRPDIPLVGVFVNDDTDRICRLLQQGTIDIAQLHGSESPETIQEIADRTGKPVWKAFQVKTPADVAAAIQTPAEHPLLDSGTGSGVSFDWSLVAGVERPFLLAGGLNPDNLAAAIAQVQPWCVDISSGTETDKVKDQAKIQRAVEIAHSLH
jgi:phosphoribosylanthranilate isomerase